MTKTIGTMNVKRNMMKAEKEANKKAGLKIDLRSLVEGK